MIYGYARVSTGSQSEAAQVAALKRHGAGQVFREVAQGDKTDRAQLARLLHQLDGGDVLMVTWLDRLARSTRDLLNTLAAITGKQAGFRSLADRWADTTTPHGRLMLTVLGGLAEFEKELIRARTTEGRARQGSRRQARPQMEIARASEARSDPPPRPRRRASTRDRPQLQRFAQHDFSPQFSRLWEFTQMPVQPSANILLTTIQTCIKNGERLLDESYNLEFETPPSTQFFLVMTAQEEFAKAFILYLTKEAVVPFSVHVLRAINDHACKYGRNSPGDVRRGKSTKCTKWR